MNAAASSCRTRRNWIRSRRWRSASMKPLMPSPGSPNTTLTPQSMRRSTTRSAVLSFFSLLITMSSQLEKHFAALLANGERVDVLVGWPRFYGARPADAVNNHALWRVERDESDAAVNPHRGTARSALLFVAVCRTRVRPRWNGTASRIPRAPTRGASRHRSGVRSGDRVREYPRHPTPVPAAAARDWPERP